MIKDVCKLSHLLLLEAGKGLSRLDFVENIAKLFFDHTQSDDVDIYLGDPQKILVVHLAGQSSQTIFLQDEQSKTVKSCLSQGEINIDNLLPFLSSYFNCLPSDFQGIHKQENCYLITSINNQTGSALVLPFFFRSNEFGIVLIKKNKSGFYTQEDLSFYSALIPIMSDSFVLQYAQEALRERVKEISCLYEISQIANTPDQTMSLVLQRIIDLLPKAMQFNEIAYARLIIDNQEYLSSNYLESTVKIISEVIINYQLRGYLEVNYSQNNNPSYRIAFLKEEKKLLDTVAGQIALIIERRQAEEATAKLQEQLRHADRLATIGQLAAGIAHEINEPLSTILGFAQLIDDAESPLEQVKLDLKKIINASLHAREVVRKLMLFSRQMPPKKESINLNKIIKDGIYLLENRCTKNGIEIIRVLSNDLPTITADPGQIHQILINLLVNSMQAMPEGGKLSIYTGLEDDYVYFTIQDNGIGMSEDIKEKIFLPFYTTKDIDQGTGLGLSVVHGIINSHNGKIHVDSTEGKGTTFTIYLPGRENG